MNLTVLGKYGPFPAAGGACSGYLIQEGKVKVLIDCGNGVLSRLQQVCDIRDLDAIIISHLHSDHICDLMVLRYALDIWTARGMRRDVPLPLYLPSSPAEEFSRVAYKNVFSLQPIYQELEIEIGPLRFSFMEMAHSVQSFAVCASIGEKRMVYSGDTGCNDMLEIFARRADLLVADAGLLHRHKTGPTANHMTGAEVGRVAAAAGVKRLILSHIWPGYDEQEVLAEAELYYNDPIIAREMECYDI